LLNRLIHRGVAPIGLDIGTGGVRLVQLRRTASGIEAFAAARIEKRPGEDADATLPERLLENLRRRVESGDFVGRECVMTFPDHWLSTRSVRLPIMPPEETDAALKLEAAERLGFDEDTPGEVSWVRAGKVRQGDDWREEIILAGAERAQLTELVDLVSETGLQPIAVEPSFLSLGRVYSRRYRREGDKDNVRLGLDIGLRNTSVFVLRGTDVAFYKPLRLSGADFTRAVAERLDLSTDAATDLRRQRLRSAGSGFDASVDRTVYEASRPLIEELAREASLCLRYFTVAFTGERPIEVFTTGDEGSEPRLAETLGSTLRLNHRVGDPFEHMTIGPNARLGSWPGAHAAWSAAAGLSLRGLPARKANKPVTNAPDAKADDESRRRNDSRPKRREAA